jgi:hypothetical protein
MTLNKIVQDSVSHLNISFDNSTSKEKLLIFYNSYKTVCFVLGGMYEME